MTSPPPRPTAPGNGIVAATGAVMPTPTIIQSSTSSVLTAPSQFTPSTGDHKISIYLDKAPGYWQLPACAMTPISTIVRDMSKGCGDGGRLTSYTCFCTDSYFKARWDISTDIASSCSRSNNNNNHPTTISAASATSTTATLASDSGRPFPQAAVESALGVFEAYCDVGVAQGVYVPAGASSFGEPILSLMGIPFSSKVLWAGLPGVNTYSSAISSQAVDEKKEGATSASHNSTNGGGRIWPTPPLSVGLIIQLCLVFIPMRLIMGP